ncbi:MAG: tRNA uridine-5-carboxymethylaminomethyl(34) synthesis GTPase MnmE [Rickettsiales bacterium]|jgi:tRNA modification GTPase|nr:tRNA uridine-5-carboxymethylaminomethyl(34) synthesis GTPase MnmE [Rickettsiales bacterium]
MPTHGTTDTIFAPLTIEGKCGVYVLRISGSKALKCLLSLGISRRFEHRKATLCRLRDRNGSDLDRALVVFFQSPRSFTGEDVCEISLHCSRYIIDRVFSILSALDGVRFAENGEFSKRAFLNGKFDLVQAESIVDLVNSETELQHRNAIRQLSGKNSSYFEKLREDMIDLASNLEGYLDFPDEDMGIAIQIESEGKITDLVARVTQMLDDNNVGIRVKNGIKVSIVGKPNVGKSTLLNFIANEDLAIVSARPGTTRDVLQISSIIGGIPVKFFDTAGIRETSDDIEIEGVRRAVANAKDADFRILLLEPDNIAIDPKIKNLIDSNTIILLNKIDLATEEKIKSIELKYPGLIGISLKHGLNTDKIKGQLLSLIEKTITPFVNSGITQERYRIELLGVLNNLKKIDFNLQPLEIILEHIRCASLCVGRITGKINADEILDEIFRKFCIGK